MMNKTFSLLLLLSLAATSACTGDHIGEREFSGPMAETADELSIDLRIAYEFTDVDEQVFTDIYDSEDGPETVEGSICECSTEECREQYVRDTMGCNLCLDVVCEDGSFSGACVLCDDQH